MMQLELYRATLDIAVLIAAQLHAFNLVHSNSAVLIGLKCEGNGSYFGGGTA
jgi:hypothetical protein